VRHLIILSYRRSRCLPLPVAWKTLRSTSCMKTQRECMCTLNTKASFTSIICNAMTVHPELELKEMQVSLLSALLHRERQSSAFPMVRLLLSQLRKPTRAFPNACDCSSAHLSIIGRAEPKQLQNQTPDLSATQCAGWDRNCNLNDLNLTP